MTLPIRLLIADVDGTLVTQDKVLTDRARDAVQRVKDAGVLFAITSGRPPRGMKMLFEPLNLTTPVPGFNGGLYVHPDLSVIEQHVLPASIPPLVIKTMEAHGLDVWIYQGNEWFIRKRDAPHVAREQHTVQFEPTIVNSFDGLYENVVKIVGVSDDLEAVAKCETDAQGEFGKQVSAARSQPYYLDVTHPSANKGAVALWFSKLLNIPTAQIATIGDQPNDTLMFAQSGLSIAMGNASPQVQAKATSVTASNQEEGFAKAIDDFILPAARA